MTIEVPDAPPAKVGRREQNKADKRRRIIAAATKLFEVNGFESTTTAAIAEAADIGAGTLYLYVNSKEDLLVAVFREEVGRAWEMAFSSVDPAAPVKDQLLGAFGSVVQFHENDPSLARAFFKELLFVSEPVRAGVTDFMRGFFRQLNGLLEEAQRRGLLRADVPVPQLSNNLYAAWYLLMQRRFSGALTVEDVHRLMGDAFGVALLALTPERSERTLTATD